MRATVLLVCAATYAAALATNACHRTSPTDGATDAAAAASATSTAASAPASTTDATPPAEPAATLAATATPKTRASDDAPATSTDHHGRKWRVVKGQHAPE